MPVGIDGLTLVSGKDVPALNLTVTDIYKALAANPFGKPNTARKRFDRWCAAGVWARVAAALGDPDLEELQLDSTTVKAHPVASAGRRRPAEKKRRPTTAGASAEAGAG